MRKVYEKPQTAIVLQYTDILTTSNELTPTGITFGTITQDELKPEGF